LSIKTLVMQSIYEAATLKEILSRIDKLTPETKNLWGKMDVGQMLAHCSVPIEVALGDVEPQTTFIGRVIGPLIKSVITNEKPFKRNSPTDKSFIMTDSKDFQKEKARLTSLLTRLSNTNPESMGNRKHPFFGKLTPGEWSNSKVKHLDHHLRQFGA